MLLVPGRPTRDGLTWWAWSDGSGEPQFAVRGPGGEPHEVRSHKLDRDIHVVATRGLASDTAYELSARAPSGDAGTISARTLPAPGPAPFTFAVGSCYAVSQDLGLLEATYPPPLFRTAADPIRLRMLVGDQIYMDLDPMSGQPIPGAQPVAGDRYRGQWQTPSFGSFLSRTPTICMPDDHEYWNDYPHGDVWLLWAKLANAAPFQTAYDAFQGALNLHPSEIFAYGGNDQQLRSILYWRAKSFPVDDLPLPMFVLDTRSTRTRFDAAEPHFAKPELLDAAIGWLGKLSAPGILVISQPFIGPPADWWSRTLHAMGDVKLPDYAADYGRLCRALFSAPHDVLVLTGDIHWSRLYQCQSAARPNRRIFELVSSPLARIPADGDSDEVGTPTGKISWDGGIGNWIRLFARNASMTYATVSLRRQTNDGTWRADVSIWGAQAKTDINLSRLAGANIILR